MLKGRFTNLDRFDAGLVVLWAGMAIIPGIALLRGEPDRYPNENSGMLMLCITGLLLSLSALVASRAARYLCVILSVGLMVVMIRMIVRA